VGDWTAIVLSRHSNGRFGQCSPLDWNDKRSQCGIPVHKCQELHHRQPRNCYFAHRCEVSPRSSLHVRNPAYHTEQSAGINEFCMAESCIDDKSQACCAGLTQMQSPKALAHTSRSRKQEECSLAACSSRHPRCSKSAGNVTLRYGGARYIRSRLGR
jgi:hypothetical protein